MTAICNTNTTAPNSDLIDEGAGGVLDWQWPMSPRFFKVYDKYADIEVTLSADADEWIVPVGGYSARFQFAAGADGTLQRKLVMLTQAGNSPAAIKKFTRSLTQNWQLYKQLLSDGPSQLKGHWSKHVSDIDTANAGKTTLRLACMAESGLWRPAHLPLIKGLDTKAREVLLAQRARLKRRETVLTLDTQAALVRVLDECACGPPLSEQEAEGLTALALGYQHGIRPVQLLSLRVEHVRLLRDASEDVACVISFHAAKQAEGGEYEIIRQVKPEWATFVEQLHTFATRACRPRLFECKHSDQLWSRVRTVCARSGVALDFSAYALRHTAAQALADAGHDRDSIRNFLGHTNDRAANTYLRASRQLSDLVNAALGASKLYGQILSLAEGKFVSVEEMARASEDEQIGAVVGERLVAGVGLCRSGQSHCRYNPVTSCYGCSKFLPSLYRAAHEEAVAGMREQVLVYMNQGAGIESPAYLQLIRALAGAQQALQAVDRISRQAD